MKKPVCGICEGNLVTPKDLSCGLECQNHKYINHKKWFLESYWICLKDRKIDIFTIEFSHNGENYCLDSNSRYGTPRIFTENKFFDIKFDIDKRFWIKNNTININFVKNYIDKMRKLELLK